MARWIDATPAQRWHQYQKPADKRTVAEADLMDAEWRKLISRMWANRHANPTASRRRLRTELKLWRNHRQSVVQAAQRLAEFG